MTAPFIRIISDLHYGDQASQVKEVAQLSPVLIGPAALVINGDAIDTRAGPDPDHTAHCLAEIRNFVSQTVPKATFITGNHDPDISEDHEVQLAEGLVWVTHGDIVFDDIVPWGRDAPRIRSEIAKVLAGSPENGASLAEKFRAWRIVAASIPQRHQSERNRLKYAVRFLEDTIWPPWRIPRMIGAWTSQAGKVAALAKSHRPKARFALVGHTHYPGIRQTETGMVVINTGSYCRPLGGMLVDLSSDRLQVRRIEKVRGEFRPGSLVREFSLAET